MIIRLTKINCPNPGGNSRFDDVLIRSRSRSSSSSSITKQIDAFLQPKQQTTDVRVHETL
jgi:hypothetical protein